MTDYCQNNPASGAGPQVVIHDAQRRQWLHFQSPRRLIVATTLAQVRPALLAVEQAVRQHGCYAAGFLSYQAAPAFDPALRVCPGGAMPLLWFGLFAAPTLLDPQQLTSPAAPLPAWQMLLDKSAYLEAIQRIKEFIRRGESYQVNYTYPLQCRFSDDPWLLFLHLQQAQQGDYGAYLDMGRHVICSASPELFFQLDGSQLVTRPMKGTAARGGSAAEDARQRRFLADSLKDRAENVMIVDMLRNDLGKIARPGSVVVDALFHLEQYPTVWQMTSSVRGHCTASLGEIFSALFPCASITGAPKVQTMQIIAELERSPRQIYTGSIGFIAPQGRAQFNVAIRTALVDRQQQCAEYRVGGGIVWDSDPEREYQETQLKARVLQAAPPPMRLLETLLWEPGSGCVLLDEHLQRLAASARYFNYPLDASLLRQQLFRALAAQYRQRLRVRLLLDRHGQVELQFFALPRQRRTQPLRLAVARTAVHSHDVLLYHKTDLRQRYELLRQQAAPADDVLMVNERGELTETTVANVVIYQHGRWLTPPVECGLLPGTFRRRLLEQGRIHEQVLRIEQLSPATLIYTINSLHGWRWAQLQALPEVTSAGGG